MIIILVILRAILGAVLFRGRGGLFNYIACWMAGREPSKAKLVSQTEACVLYAVLMVTLQIDRMPMQELALVAAALFVGTLPGWPAAPTEAKDRAGWWTNFTALALRGLWFTAPVGAVLWTLGYSPWFGFVGLSLAVVYAVAAFIPSRIPQFRQGRELGEATFGGVQALAFALI